VIHYRVVTFKEPKGLTGSDQNGEKVATGDVSTLSRMSIIPSGLRVAPKGVASVYRAELGKPDALPSKGVSNREERDGAAGSGGDKKRMPTL